MPAYVSARFEKTSLISTNQTRVIVRSIDQGDVPPSPSATYFPTAPDDYSTFIVAEWAGDSLGETFLNAADLNEITTLDYLPLNQIEDTSVDFATMLPLLSGAIDVIEIYLDDPTLWTSEEYPGSNFVFLIDSVIDVNNLKLAEELPAFSTALSWEVRRTVGFVTTVMGQGSTGITRRFGMPLIPSQTFLEKRFNAYFDSAVAAENFVEATKAQMVTLANEHMNATVVSENYTAEPNV